MKVKALAKLPKQYIFQMIERLIGIFADINCVKNVPKDLLGQTGEGIGIVEFLGSDALRGELSLDEAELDVQFLLIVGTKFHL
jgi:hypothetical protein